MSRIRVSRTIDAPRSRVWRAVRDIPSHVEWMEDAVAIRFTSRRRRGVGTTFECDTRVGPIRLTDVMRVTEWRPGRVMGIRHVGVVTGSGRFTLRRQGLRRTRFTWEERLVFPWWLGGPVGAVVGGQVMKRIWARNIQALERHVRHDRREPSSQ